MSEQGLGLWCNGVDTYVARDAEHARQLMAAQTGEQIDDVPAPDEWSKDEREFLKIADEDKGAQTKSPKRSPLGYSRKWGSRPAIRSLSLTLEAVPTFGPLA